MGTEGTSVTEGLEIWAAGGMEQVGLFINSTDRLSPLGSGCSILKRTGQHANALIRKCRYNIPGSLTAAMQYSINNI